MHEYCTSGYNAFDFPSEKGVAGIRSYFVGDENGVKVVRHDEIFDADGNPEIFPPYGAVFMIPGTPGEVRLEWTLTPEETVSRKIKGKHDVSIVIDPEGIEKILKKELHKIADKNEVWEKHGAGINDAAFVGKPGKKK